MISIRNNFFWTLPTLFQGFGKFLELWVIHEMNTKVWKNRGSSYLAKNECWTKISLDIFFETLTSLGLPL